VLSRVFLSRLALVALACVALLRAEPVDQEQITAAWQTLMLAATRAASAKDYKSAEELLHRATQITSRFSTGDPRVGVTENTIGLIYRDEKKYAEAGKAFQNALTLFERSYGEQSLDAGNIEFNIASVLMADGKYEASLPYIEKSRGVFTKIVGPGSLKTAATYCMLGEAFRNLDRFDDAEKLLKQCADIREAAGGLENPELADALYNLGLVYQHQGKLALAEPQLKLAAKIRELTLGVTSLGFAEALEAHSATLKSLGRDPEAKKEEALAESVRRQAGK
jgi:tetratricopeptide (TPR) repeat protein